MPGSYWKNSIEGINNGLDKCQNVIDSLNNADIKKEVYSTPNTLVEVSIKTKKPSSNIRNASNSRKPLALKKVSNVPSTSKKAVLTKHSQKKGVKIDSNDDETPPQRKTFQNRTLQMFLSEIKSVLKKGDADQALTLLQDVEYIAFNLNPSEKVSGNEENITQANSSVDNSSLKIRLSELENINEISQKELVLKEKQIEEFKSIIAKLNTNSNDMVEILKTKLNVEENCKSLQVSVLELKTCYQIEQKKNQSLEKSIRNKNFEIDKLQRIISDLKNTLSHDIEELERNQPEAFSTLVDLGLSASMSKCSTSTSKDSAIDAGSESVAAPPRFSIPPPIPQELVAQPENSNKSQEVETRAPSLEKDHSTDVSNNQTQSVSLAKDVMDNKVKSFLEKMRERADMSIPEIRSFKKFEEESVNIDMTNDSDSPENVFHQDLESTLYVSSNDSC